MLGRLRSMAQQRTDGAWELLATSAGNPESTRLTCDMLSCDALDDVVYPYWMIEQRVEALSAFSPTALAMVASEWPRPIQTSSRTLHTAWRRGLRHLLPISSFTREEFAVPELVTENSILWNVGDSATITWDQAFRIVDEKPMFDYDVVRLLARRPLAYPLPSVDQILRCPVGMLRLLRGHVQRLDVATREYLGQSSKVCLSTDLRSGAYIAQEITVDRVSGDSTITKSIKYIPLGETALEGNASAAPWIVELCREIHSDLVDDLANQLAEQIPRLTDPRLAAPLVYLLLTPWTLP